MICFLSFKTIDALSVRQMILRGEVIGISTMTTVAVILEASPAVNAFEDCYVAIAIRVWDSLKMMQI